MEIFFNPYPGAAKNEEEGFQLAVATTDALLRLKSEYVNIQLTSHFSETGGDLPPSRFVLVRDANVEFYLDSFKNKKEYHDKLLLLLDFFSRGRVINTDDITRAEDWILSILGTSAPVLELAAKNRAIALTFPTEKEWRVDLLDFSGRQEKLHNLWGQEDISAIITHCIEENKNIPDRFKISFDADFCPGALNTAPAPAFWEKLGFFKTMELAKKVNYKAGVKCIKTLQGIEKTKHGPVLELRFVSSGHRIYFTHREKCSPEILIGGFYVKSQAQSEGEAMKIARKRIDEY